MGARTPLSNIIFYNRPAFVRVLSFLETLMLRTARKFLVAAAAAVVVFALSIAPAPVQATAISNYWQNSFAIDNAFRGQSYTQLTNIYIALATTSGSAAACGTEVSTSSTGYARVAVAATLAAWAGTQGAGTTVASSGTSGTTSNNAAITFGAPTATWGSIVSFCAFDASTAGHLLFQSNLTTAKTVNSGDAAPSFAAGALTYTVT
jgi:hypothetical protein